MAVSSRRQRNGVLWLAFGVWPDPLAYLAGGETGLCYKRHTYKGFTNENTSWVTADQGDSNKEMHYFKIRIWLLCAPHVGQIWHAAIGFAVMLNRFTHRLELALSYFESP